MKLCLRKIAFTLFLAEETEINAENCKKEIKLLQSDLNSTQAENKMEINAEEQKALLKEAKEELKESKLEVEKIYREYILERFCVV